MVDKPSGLTSHDVVGRVRRAAGQHRVGHTGTLDPMATGVLVLCLGRATRLVRFLQDSPKTYAATAVLGIETDSQDADGEVVATADTPVPEEEVEAALAAMVGDLQQVPPMVSAVRVGGERLHEVARRGETVDRDPREVTIHELEVTGHDPGPPQAVSFVVTCSPGTYVRTLAHDAGQALGVGAHLSALRRTRNARWSVDEAVALDVLKDRAAVEEHLVPAQVALGRVLPSVEVEVETARGLVHGGALPGQDVDGPYAVTLDTRLVGVYRDRDGAGRAEVVMLRPEDLE
ncbi:MAG: tRNA pseudouridine(55) synthase TruB [Nitriliruptorales bacterium]|nr:tRNA pseudouridine(55) synthase TruB [Nitriliruptorales bacterium]